jgi:hypothetical protein
MSYGLSFSEEFFTGNGENDIYEMPPSEKPTNVLQAAVSLPPDQLQAIGQDVFGYDAESAQIWSTTESAAFEIVDKVRETDRCDDLSTPVTVYIDEEGYYSLTVYDGR